MFVFVNKIWFYEPLKYQFKPFKNPLRCQIMQSPNLDQELSNMFTFILYIEISLHVEIFKLKNNNMFKRNNLIGNYTYC